MVKILVTNDDGVHSQGLKILADSMMSLGRVYVVAPETPKSASGLGITLHKPLRLEKIRYWNMDIYITNGTPSDVVYLTLNELTTSLDLTVSGVNVGDNTSIQVILSSGTIGAAAQAALLGIPAIAFSANVDDASEFEDEEYAKMIKSVTRAIAKAVIDEGLPENVDLLSVNYPRRITPDTKVKITRPAKIKFQQKVNVNYDPYGRKYYWLYGKIVDPIPGTDVYTVYIERAIAITPVKLDFYPSLGGEIEAELKHILMAAEKGLRHVIKTV
ncbi:MAG: 5'/3'-nucleotidase SurE [Desulfurococcales archaeon]|nr:5'/3'-nucleotidase SurE [Desulfurococcales archaeon]